MRTYKFGLVAASVFAVLLGGCSLPGLQLAVFPPFQSSPADSDVTGVRLSALYGSSHYVEGVDLGLLGDESESDTGLMVNGLYSYCRGSMDGFQLSGLWSQTRDLAGLQVSGITSRSKGYTSGVQLSGIGNYSAGRGLEVQVAGVVNDCDTLRGGQVAALANVAEFDAEGAQVGLVNTARHSLEGVQVGLVNSADSLNGVQIGLLNRARNGWLPVVPFLNVHFAALPPRN